MDTTAATHPSARLRRHLRLRLSPTTISMLTPHIEMVLDGDLGRQVCDRTPARKVDGQ